MTDLINKRRCQLILKSNALKQISKTVTQEERGIFRNASLVEQEEDTSPLERQVAMVVVEAPPLSECTPALTGHTHTEVDTLNRLEERPGIPQPSQTENLSLEKEEKSSGFEMPITELLTDCLEERPGIPQPRLTLNLSLEKEEKNGHGIVDH